MLMFYALVLLSGLGLQRAGWGSTILPSWLSWCWQGWKTSIHRKIGDDWYLYATTGHRFGPVCEIPSARVWAKSCYSVSCMYCCRKQAHRLKHNNFGRSRIGMYYFIFFIWGSPVLFIVQMIFYMCLVEWALGFCSGFNEFDWPRYRIH